MTWNRKGRDEVFASAGYRVEPIDDERLVLWVSYRWRDTEDIDRPITAEPSYPHYGGVRYWFRCPRLVDGRMPCWRRVAKLYLPSVADSSPVGNAST